MENESEVFETWLDAKHEEDKAREARIEAENKLVSLFGCKDEGSQTHKSDGYKVTITGRINRTIDEAAWDSVSDRVPVNLSPIKYKPQIDNRDLKYLQDNEPAIYRIVCEAITAKPGKPGVKVERV